MLYKKSNTLAIIICKMNLRSLDLNLLTVFDAILTERSLTRASARLGMSQPAVSNALARLRLALNDPLFLRTAQGMVPTPRAKLLAEPVRQALDLIQNSLRQDSAFDYASSHRVFVVAVEDYGEAVIMPRFMDWLTRTAPGVRIKIRPEPSEALREELRQGAVDMAMDYFPIRDEEFHVHHLMDDELVSMVRQDHPTVGDTLSLEQYIALPHVILTPRTPKGSVVDRGLKKLGLTRNIALQVPHFLTMPLIVASTSFVCTLPKRMAHVYADHFRLKVLKAPIDFPAIPIYLIWSKSMSNDPGHRWFRDSFSELCRRI